MDSNTNQNIAEVESLDPSLQNVQGFVSFCNNVAKAVNQGLLNAEDFQVNPLIHEQVR